MTADLEVKISAAVTKAATYYCLSDLSAHALATTTIRYLKQSLETLAYQTPIQWPGSGSIELCINCSEKTGRAGIEDDSLYFHGIGPFCEDCFDFKKQDSKSSAY